MQSTMTVETDDQTLVHPVSLLPDISSFEVLTSFSTADMMLDQLPASIWSDPDIRWLDPACKSGSILLRIKERLMDGLSAVFPDPYEREAHILKNMLYGYGLSQVTALTARQTLYSHRHATRHHPYLSCDDGNIFFKRQNKSNSLHAFPDGVYDKKRMHFDVIIGNPPYQLADGGGGGGASSKPLYNLFTEKAIALNPRYLIFIIPALWYSGGKGLDKFREMMLADRSIRLLIDYPASPHPEPFPHIKLHGGVCIFLRDNEYQGDCEIQTITNGNVVSTSHRGLGDNGDIFIRSEQSLNILSKVQKRQEPTAATNVASRTAFGLPSKFDEFLPEGTARSPELVEVRARRDHKEIHGLIKRSDLKKKLDWIDKYKVVTPKAHDRQGRYSVLGPGVICTETFLVVGVFDDKTQADNYAAYLSTDLIRFLIDLHKPSHNMSSKVFAFVPWPDTTRAWSDQDLSARYEISPAEQKIIKETLGKPKHKPKRTK